MNRRKNRMRSPSQQRLALCSSLLAFALVGGIARAQENSLDLTGAETIPGSRISLYLEAQLNQPIRAFQVGVRFPRLAMHLTGVSFAGTELQSERFDIFDVDISTTGSATLVVSLDEMAPFDEDIPAGSAVRLARLDFEMNQGLEAGAEFEVDLASGIGFPPLPALVFTADDELSVALGAGIVRIRDENVLKIESLEGVRPGEISTMEFKAFNQEPLQGFTIAMSYDPSQIHLLSAYIDDTITDAVGAEFVDPVIDNESGEMILGVLLDVMPPFENQLIPASGLALTIAKADFVVHPLADPDEIRDPEIALSLVDGLGKPPKKNIFVIDNYSVLPLKDDGEVVVTEDVAFLRGDAAMDGRVDISDAIRVVNYALLQIQGVPCQKAADGNDDGRVDLADVLYILLYLFDRGPVIPEPFPERGFDPTPDTLSCNAAETDAPFRP